MTAPRRWIAICTGCALLVVFLGSQTFVAESRYDVHPPWGETLSVAFTCVVFWALAAVLVAWLARRFPLARGRMATSIGVHVVAALALSGVEAVLCVVTFWIVWAGAFPTAPRLLSLVVADLHTNVMMYALVLGLARELRAARPPRGRARARSPRDARGAAPSPLPVQHAELDLGADAPRRRRRGAHAGRRSPTCSARRSTTPAATRSRCARSSCSRSATCRSSRPGSRTGSSSTSTSTTTRSMRACRRCCSSRSSRTRSATASARGSGRGG